MIKKVHFLGIAGSGASAVAQIAKSQGFKVSGCDKVPPFNEFTKGLDKNFLFTGHSASHIGGGDTNKVDILAVTPAIFSQDPENIELVDAKKRGIEVLTWQEFMGKYLETGKFVIAVCGTHGKSTTTAMIGTLLEDANLDPIVELGAIVNKWGKNFRIGNGKYFVTEADEFNDNFLVSHPNITIVTNIEMDHPEYFKDFNAYKQSFLNFFYQTKDFIIANLSDFGVRQVLEVFQKNKEKKNHPQIIDFSKSEIFFPLLAAGKHNQLNATAVYHLGLILSIDSQIDQTSLRSFTGIGRRFEYIGQYKGSDVYSDFGHHPTEIKATMEAAIEKFPDKKIILIFQPHMFSRTKILFDDFVKVFKSLPIEIIILDIYPSREKDTGLVKSEMLVHSTNKENVVYNSPEEIKETIHKKAGENKVLFFMGAGDIDKLARKIVEK